MFTVQALSIGGEHLSNDLAIPDADYLSRLDDNSLLTIFDLLDTVELINFASVSPRFHNLILQHYVIPFNNGESRITIVINEFDQKSELYIQLSFDEDTKLILGDSLLRAIQVLGQFITRLDIYNISPGDPERTLTLGKYIKKYCSNSLKQLLLYKVDANLLDQLTSSIANVTNLTLLYDLSANGIDLNQIFPKLQRLSIDFDEKPMDLSFLRHNFMNLEHFELSVGPNGDNRANIEYFIRSNPQIQNLAVPLFGNATFVEYIRDHLPKLESLELDNSLV